MTPTTETKELMINITGNSIGLTDVWDKSMARVFDPPWS